MGHIVVPEGKEEMTGYHQSPQKWSGELLNILTKHGYRTIDKYGRGVVHLTRLKKEKSIQDVARWMVGIKEPGILLGELRQQLEINGLGPLRDEANTELEAHHTYGFQNFLKKRPKPAAYPAGTILDHQGRPIK